MSNRTTHLLPHNPREHLCDIIIRAVQSLIITLELGPGEMATRYPESVELKKLRATIETVSILRMRMPTESSEVDRSQTMGRTPDPMQSTQSNDTDTDDTDDSDRDDNEQMDFICIGLNPTVALAWQEREDRRIQKISGYETSPKRAALDGVQGSADLGFFKSVPTEVLRMILENLLVSKVALSPLFKVCRHCSSPICKTDVSSGYHSSNCALDPNRRFGLQPQILRTCRMFLGEGINLLYSRNSFNFCDLYTNHQVFFFQSIGEENTRSLRNCSINWPHRSGAEPALLYLRVCERLETITIRRNGIGSCKTAIKPLVELRAKNIKFLEHQEGSSTEKAIMQNAMNPRRALAKTYWEDTHRKVEDWYELDWSNFCFDVWSWKERKWYTQSMREQHYLW